MLEQKSLQSLKHEDSTRACPECSSENLDLDNGELSCARCGLVIDE